MDKKARKFVQHIREHLEEYGGKLIVGTGKEVNTGEGIRASGLFNDNPVVIRVAKNCKDFIGVLAHEYAHFLQWLDCPKNIQSADDNAGIVFFEWLSGQDYESRDVQRAMTRIMAMERDAERRAVSIIKHFDLNVDIEDYIKKANCYIYMHWIMRERRSWNYRRGAKDPMKSRKLIGMMPDSFKAKSDKKIPKRIREALLSYYP